MSENTLSQIRALGEKLLSELERNFYTNYCGLSKKSDIQKILNSQREFGDPELFHYIGDKIKEGEPGNISLTLLEPFLANMFALSASSAVIDKILTLESSLSIRIGEKRLPFRSILNKIVNEPKKRKRDEIEEYRVKALEELIPAYLDMRYLTGGAAEELGFSSYIQLTDHTLRSETAEDVQKAEIFLRDTEYVSKEMLEWFFSRHMELPLRDASRNDLNFLLNSFELKACFPEKEFIGPAARVLDDSGLVNSSDVQADYGKRNRKSTQSMLFLTSPPREMKVSINPVGGPADYEAYLSALGSALSYAFTQSDDYFEFRYLRDPIQTQIFSTLYKNLIYESKWLERYIEEDRNEDFYKLLFLRRLMNARLYAGAAVYENLLFSGEDSESLKPAFVETMERALNVKVSEADFLILKDLRKPLSSVYCFESSLIEPSLSSYLKERYDEEWWRVPGAGSELRELWTRGGRLRANDISELTGFNDSSDILLSIFERELG